MWDSLAICETLAERHPEAKLWPDDAPTRAHARALMRPRCIPAFPICATSLAMDFARNLPLPELREATKDQIARILKIWTDALAAHGGPIPVWPLLDRRLHVCAGVFALSHL